MDPLVTLINLVLVFLLIAANGFFVAAEFSLVSVRPTRIDQLAEEGHRVARIIQRAKADPNRFLLAAQIGITVASLALGWVAEPTIASLLVELITWAHGALAEAFVHAIAAVLTFTLITYLHIVLGENIPKALALQRTEPTIFFTALPMEWLSVAFTPFIKVLDATGNWLMRRMGIPAEPGHHTVYSPEEIKRIVMESHEVGVLHSEEQRLLSKVFDFGDKDARDVMVPRPDIKALSAETAGVDLLVSAVEHGHSRYPIYEGSIDHVLGLVHLKDLLARQAKEGLDGVTARDLLREVVFVPENKAIATMLAEFRAEKRQMAIVMDEYGGTAGLVTLEDLLEEIVGEIEDEFSVPENFVERLGTKRYRLDGRHRIEDFNARFGTNLETDEFDTVGGWIFGRLGREPKVGDGVDFAGGRLVIDRLEGHRIARVVFEGP